MHPFDFTSRLAGPIAGVAFGLWLPAAAIGASGVAPSAPAFEAAAPTAVAPGAASPSTSAADSAAAACEITDLMPEFWRFWQAAQEVPREAWPALFRGMVRQPNADIYDAVFRNLPISEDQLLAGSLDRVEANLAILTKLSTALGADLPRRIARFREEFPDFRCDVPVRFLYSAGAFDGAIRQVAGRRNLMFGVDLIAQLHGEQAEPLYIHELFHLYHAQQSPADDEERLFWSLWREGLATWVACGPSPDRTTWSACGLPAVAEEPGRVGELARLVTTALDGTSREDYARFFLGSESSASVPARSGYWIGYLVAQRLAETRSSRELAKLDPQSARPLIAGVLSELAR